MSEVIGSRDLSGQSVSATLRKGVAKEDREN